MELIYEKFFIQGGEGVTIIIPTQNRKHLGSSKFEFKLSVFLLQITFCGECATVHFKVQFAVPNLKIFVIFKVLFKEFRTAHMLTFWHNGQFIKTVHKFNHFFCTARTAVTIAKHIHSLTALVFVYICFPILLNLRRSIPSDEMGRRNTSINTASVNSLPNEIIVRKTVCIIPS